MQTSKQAQARGTRPEDVYGSVQWLPRESQGPAASEVAMLQARRLDQTYGPRTEGGTKLDGSWLTGLTRVAVQLRRQWAGKDVFIMRCPPRQATKLVQRTWNILRTYYAGHQARKREQYRRTCDRGGTPRPPYGAALADIYRPDRLHKA